MTLTIRKATGRDAEELNRRIKGLERELESRLQSALGAVGLMDENQERIGDLDELISSVVEAEAAVQRRSADVRPMLPVPPKQVAAVSASSALTAAMKASSIASVHEGHKMDDITQLEMIEKLAYGAGSDARTLRKSAEDLYDTVVKRYESEGVNASRAHYLAMKDPIGERAYEMVTEMTDRELEIRSVLGR
ncbi:MAG: hypothetical protein JKX88_10135 [Marinicaulis sp.]|nr:hypothetical protein [Marinicaulis sp.]